MVLMRQRFQASPGIDVKPLLAAARDKSSPQRAFAVMALAAFDPHHRNPDVTVFWQEHINNADRAQLLEAIKILQSFTALESLEIDWPALVSHKDVDVQSVTWRALESLGSNGYKTDAIVPKLLQVLKDPKRTDDYLPTIRALSALRRGKPSDDVFSRLGELASDTKQPLNVRIASTVAKIRLTSDETYKSEFFDRLRDENKDRKETPEFQSELRKLLNDFELEERTQ
jgi:hypothetical protein